MDNKPGAKKNWWEILYKALRGFIAILLTSYIGILLFCGNNPISCIKIDSLSSGAVNTTITTSPLAPGKTEGNAPGAKTETAGVAETKVEEVLGISTQWVWAYGLRLAAWIGMLGILVWAIVVLIREDI